MIALAFALAVYLVIMAFLIAFSPMLLLLMFMGRLILCSRYCDKRLKLISKASDEWIKGNRYDFQLTARARAEQELDRDGWRQFYKMHTVEQMYARMFHLHRWTFRQWCPNIEEDIEAIMEERRKKHMLRDLTS